MANWRKRDRETLARGLQRVLQENRFWPDEETMGLAHSILPVPATEVAVVRKGRRGWELLVQYREFSKEPAWGPDAADGWYLPGGYIPWAANIHTSCTQHLRKDLRNEHARLLLTIDSNMIHLSEPIVIGEKKWMPGEHPFGCPLSLICVCEIAEGEIGETDWLKWTREPISTSVPHHEAFQKFVFAWLKTSSSFKRQQAALARIIA